MKNFKLILLALTISSERSKAVINQDMSSCNEEHSKMNRKKYRPLNDKLSNAVYIMSAIVLIIVTVTGYFNFTINGLEFFSGLIFQAQAFQISFAIHLFTSFLFIALLTIYILRHVKNVASRKNEAAKKFGYRLSLMVLIISVSGLLLVRGAFELEIPKGWIRTAIYLMHIALPLLASYYYYQHRKKGANVHIARSYMWSVFVIGSICLTTLFIYDITNKKSLTTKSYLPSMLKVKASGSSFDSQKLVDNDYCTSCHKDIHESWSVSAHRFSSFNNPFYSAAVERLQENIWASDSNVNEARFCAGCHDPLVLINGGFTSEIVTNQTPYSAEGLTCTFCHSIDSVDSNLGNADFTVLEPNHYPFANSDNQYLNWLSNLLLKSNPEFHKKTFSKPVLETPQFCGSCHKVHIPESLNKYKWLRGQNHYDSFRLSGVHGTNVDSFFYPQSIKENCQSCHMQGQASNDPSAELTLAGDRFVKNHQFAAGNTAMAVLSPDKRQEIIETHQEFLKDSVSVDIVGLREEGKLDGKLVVSSANNTLKIVPGSTYIAEVVVRTKTLGHSFTNGTTDSNQVWLELSLDDANGEIVSSGKLSKDGYLPKKNVHLIKTLLVDKDGNEIKQRNVEDIVASVYNHQIPPGAASVVHYRFVAPKSYEQYLALTATLKYRKFDKDYQAFSLGEANSEVLPITTIDTHSANLMPDADLIDLFAELEESQVIRLLDYGIGLYRKPNKSEFRQAEIIFKRLYDGGSVQAGVNLLRLFYGEGRLSEASTLLTELRKANPFNSWTLDWYEANISRDLGDIEQSIYLLEQVSNSTFYTPNGDLLRLSEDDKLILALAEGYYSLAQINSYNKIERDKQLKLADAYYRQALKNDAENANAHYGLWKVNKLYGHQDTAEYYYQQHQKYKPDESGFLEAVSKARINNVEWDKEAALYRIYELD